MAFQHWPSQNLCANAESKRLDRIDSDSIMAIISENLQQSLTALLRMAGEYSGKEPPMVTIPKDYENRLLDGNQVTAFLQLYMQGVISQETLLQIVQEGEVLLLTSQLTRRSCRPVMRSRRSLNGPRLEHEEMRLEMQQRIKPTLLSVQAKATKAVQPAGNAAGGTKGYRPCRRLCGPGNIRADD